MSPPYNEQIDAQIGLGLTQWKSGKLRAAKRTFNKALSDSRSRNDKVNEAIILGDLGMVHADMGKNRLAEKCHQASLRLARELTLGELEANQLGNLAAIYVDFGMFQKAIAFFEDCRTKHDEAGRRVEVAICDIELAMARFRGCLASLDSTIATIEQVIQNPKNAGFLAGNPSMQSLLFTLKQMQGWVSDLATLNIKETEIGSRGLRPFITRIKAVIAFLRSIAVPHPEKRVKRVSEKKGLTAFVECQMLLNLGLDAYKAKKFTLALNRYWHCLALVSLHQEKFSVATTLHQLGTTYHALRKWGVARIILRICVRYCQTNDFRQLEASALYWLGATMLHNFTGNSGFKYFSRSAQLAGLAESKKDLANGFWGMSCSKFKELHVTEALLLMSRALEVELRPPKNGEGAVQCLIQIAKMHKAVGNTVSAEEALRKAQEIDFTATL